jgi:hypothetical protein
MFCKNCGAQLNDGTKFCNKCGAAQQEAVQQQNPMQFNQFAQPQQTPIQPQQAPVLQNQFVQSQQAPVQPQQNFGWQQPQNQGIATPYQKAVSDKSHTIAAVFVILTTLFLIIALFEFTAFNTKSAIYDGKKKKTLLIPVTMSSSVATLRAAGFDDFSDTVDDGWTVATTYIDLAVAILGGLILLLAVISLLGGNTASAIKAAGFAALPLILGYLFNFLLFLHFHDKSSKFYKFSSVPFIMIVLCLVTAYVATCLANAVNNSSAKKAF